MGIGTDNVYLIRTDECGKMDMSHLGKFKQCIKPKISLPLIFLESEILRAKEENALPFMVSATAGNYY